MLTSNRLPFLHRNARSRLITRAEVIETLVQEVYHKVGVIKVSGG